MNPPATLQETFFTVTPLPAVFAERVRATGRDDFNRPVSVTLAHGGEPLRDQLRRATPGERIIPCSYQAVPLPSPCAEIGPIFISAGPAAAAPLWRNELPPGYFPRTLALRAYNGANEIIDSTLAEPAAAPALIRRWLGRPEVIHLHARFAGHGCYACRFARATT